MTHSMKLHREPFDMIKSGKKDIELRLYDEKRRAISVGDEIEFTRSGGEEKMLCRVVALHIFESFAELYANLPLLRCGYTESDISTASPEDMNAYYSPDEQEKYGVVGIEMALM